MDESSCMNCKHRDTGYCPFRKCAVWNDVYCSKWEEAEEAEEET